MQNYHQHHAKEVLEVLDRVVRKEGIQYIVFAGDQVVIPLLEKQLFALSRGQGNRCTAAEHPHSRAPGPGGYSGSNAPSRCQR
jgi:hypothetical protein